MNNKTTGRGSNLSHEDRIKGGEQSHKGVGAKKNSTLSQRDKKKGGKTSGNTR